MKKNVIALFCAAVLLICLLPVGSTGVVSANTTQQYHVGYSIKNINPWVSSSFDIEKDLGKAVFVDPSTPNKKIYPSLCSLVGNQVDWLSVIANVFDDNGDGERNEEDGIFVTCTAVSYDTGTDKEKTILFFTMDAMKTYTEIVTAVRKAIVEQFGDEYGIAADQIMVSSNHSHSSPQYTASLGSYIDTDTFNTDEKVTNLKADRKTYYNWVIDQMVAAARESLADRAAASMSRGSVDATDATAALGYNGGKGYQMNAVRHYEKTVSNKNMTSQKVSYISSNATPSAAKLQEALKASSNSYSAFTQGTVVTNLSDESDNNMYVLRFEFDAKSGKQPIVFVNWRAHSTMNSGIERTSISSDYANGLRTVLKDTYGYRAAFFLGAAGNMVPAPTDAVFTENSKLVASKMDWLYEATTGSGSSLKLQKDKQTFIYGKMLAEIANYCMDEKNGCMTDTLPAGEIKNSQYSWKGEKQIYSDAMKKAALELRAVFEKAQADANNTDSFTQFVSDNASKYLPYRYTDPDTGELAILNTRLHFNSVYNQAISTSTSTQTSAMELNAILLGTHVAFVTSPNELADYYHDFSDIVNEDGTADRLSTAEIEALNDWNKLIGETYGMPFVLGYSNQNQGYIANWLDFSSNSQLFYQITGKGKQGYMVYSPGTYESLTSGFAKGQGERLMEIYKQLLESTNGDYNRVSVCEHCKVEVEWQPLFATNTDDTNWNGHYYLVEDLEKSNCRTIKPDDRLCLDLNGHTIHAVSRAFNTQESPAATGAVVSIMDSVGTGGVISESASNNLGGGVIKIAKDNTLNIYGGTYQFNNCDISKTPQKGTGQGGIVHLAGTLNLYGGTIVGAQLHDVSKRMDSSGNPYSTYTGRGGAIYLSGILNVYGGSITSGVVPEGAGMGPCVFVSSSTARINLSGDGNVENIYFYSSTTKDVLMISGEYSGTADLTYRTAVSNGMDIGNSVDAALVGATITCTNNADMNIYIDGTNLYLSSISKDAAAIVYGPNGTRGHNSLVDAVNNYVGGYIKLLKAETAAITIARDTSLDLSGNNITGKVTVKPGCTLYVMDSETDDYTVADGKYGKIANYEGTLAGVPIEATFAEDAYLMVKEKSGASFHRVNLQVYAMSLRPEVNGEAVPGLYYKSYFAGDEKVAAQVAKFGVALSISETPTKENLETKCKYSWFTGFASGKGSNDNAQTGTLLKGIMKPDNGLLVNAYNANLSVYGRAYVLLNDGTYMFGESVSRSLRQQVELIDGMWNDGKLEEGCKAPLVAMCKNFYDVTKDWKIPNILNALPKTEN